MVSTRGDPTTGADDTREARIQLAAAYRAVDYFGWSELTANHITLRLPGDPPVFLINPYGLLYSEITASSLIRIDMTGRPHDASDYPVNPAGFNIHAAIHQARADAHCVMHVHTAAGMAVSALAEGFIPLSLEGADFHRIAYHAFEGPALAHDERERLAADLGDARAMILRNHGLITVGETVGEAFLLMYRLVLACQVQLLVLQTGRPYIQPSDAILALSERKHRDFFKIGMGGRPSSFGALDFAAVMRLMTRIDSSYRN